MAMGDETNSCYAAEGFPAEGKLCVSDDVTGEKGGEDTTPTTTASECSDLAGRDELDAMDMEQEVDGAGDGPPVAPPQQLGPGPPPPPSPAAPVPQVGPGPPPPLAPRGVADHGGNYCSQPSPVQGGATSSTAPPPPPPLAPGACAVPPGAAAAAVPPAAGPGPAAPVALFSVEETVFIFDWDDTVLPSTWVQGQGLRLDEGCVLSDWQREQLTEVANITAETIRAAKRHGTVVLVTNAERGWIELSCQKFMPTLLPALENVKVLSARTTYESPLHASPLEWKMCAFENEIARIFGHENLVEPRRRKNVVSLGDSIHEREALLRATSSLPNCCSKSLKFSERPDISQILKQHTLVTSCFDKIVHHEGNLDLCIRCA